MSAPANVIVCQQGSHEWHQARCGMPTGSRCGDVIARKQNGDERAERRDYRAEVVCEILTGQPYPRRVTWEMQWGLDHEADARIAYELTYGVMVATVGFVLHPEVDRFGASPDGLVGDDGMIQIKCPTTATHLEWWRAGTVPLEHQPQMIAEMACTGRDWCDFVSFDPRMPEHLQLFVRRYHRDNKFIHMLEREVEHFNREVDDVLAGLPKKPQGVVISMDQVADDELNF